jgi:Protein of unknown function DUF86
VFSCAIERQFEIIGEALKQLSKVAPDIASKISDCRQIIAFRNIIIHGYAVLDKAIVWKVVHRHLPALERRAAVAKLNEKPLLALNLGLLPNRHSTVHFYPIVWISGIDGSFPVVGFIDSTGPNRPTLVS